MGYKLYKVDGYDDGRSAWWGNMKEALQAARLLASDGYLARISRVFLRDNMPPRELILAALNGEGFAATSEDVVLVRPDKVISHGRDIYDRDVWSTTVTLIGDNEEGV